jgi:hypothetical protein
LFNHGIIRSSSLDICNVVSYLTLSRLWIGSLCDAKIIAASPVFLTSSKGLLDPPSATTRPNPPKLARAPLARSLGSARASRAGDGALAVTNFFLLIGARQWEEANQQSTNAGNVKFVFSCFETRSTPSRARCCPRSFTFYVARPGRSIPGFLIYCS